MPRQDKQDADLKTSIGRRTRLAVALAPLFALAMTGVHAAEPSLRVVSDNGGGSLSERNIRINRLDFQPDSKVLTATSRAGNILCGTPGATTGMALNLDGTSYPLVVSGLPGGLTHPVSYANDSGVVSLVLNGVPSSACISSHVFGTGTGEGTEPDVYDLKFPGQVTRTIAEAVYFDVDSRAFQIRVAQPIICTSYGSGGLTVALADPNNASFSIGQAELLAGLSGLQYQPATLTLEPASQTSLGGAVVQCTTPGAVIEPTPGTVPSSRIFGGGFEPDGVPVGKPDVQVTLEELDGDPLAALNAVPGSNINYRVRVANIGNSPAMNVRLREFVPLPGGVSPSAMAQGGLNDSCQLIGGVGSDCGLGSLSFPIEEDGVTLQPGQAFLFTLSRRFADGVQAGAAAQAGYAAFVSPIASGIADANITDNGRWLELTPIANLPPTIGAVAIAPLAEGSVGALVSGSALVTITDPEGDDITVLTATSDDQSILPNGSVSILTTNNPGNPDEYQLSVTPAADKNGEVSVTISAGDGNSPASTREVTVTINPINDPPAFALAETEVVATSASGCPTGGICASYTDLLIGLVPGPAGADDEQSQTVVPTGLVPVSNFLGGRLPPGSCVAASVDGVDPSTFFASGLMPLLSGPNPSGGYSLLAGLTPTAGAVECSVSVTDSEAGVSPPQVFTIRYTP
jgi:uncharacterized repeat protein (TIGR01451 family)